MRRQGTEYMHFVLIPSVHMHAPLFHQASLTKHKFKDKIIKNFKTVTAGH